MKRKFFIVNASMGLMILFAILSQSFHSLEHLVKQLSEKHCHHIYHDYQTELNHGHDGLEKCFTCEFAFSSYVEFQKTNFLPHKPTVATTYNFNYTSLASLGYKGSYFCLRAPPSV